ncbi:YiiD C-terminal domain-containing protein [Chromobacterium sphagni]|uniref:Thioesterase n=1 Tax=Chromobacterium sphagni TaxID=1903179 RepID=A0ABX3CH73_9NEIS|nr:YiiD C-terminal domain-containing protein [Chromobacterium sphagni]OHX21682.1 thioesterase [Chromobacterium sphagni]
MQAADLQDYLYQHIPLSRAMEVAVAAVAPNGVTLTAPLAPNINHRATVFGGSASALAILAAWSLLHTRLRAEGWTATLVIQRNSMEYQQAIAGAFSAHAVLADADGWERFIKTLSRRGKARIEVAAVLECDGAEAGRLCGEFVALAGQRAPAMRLAQPG